MLLIISNISSGDSIWKPKRKGCKKKKVNKKGRSKTSANKTKKAPVKVPKVTEGTIDTNVDLEAVNSVSLDHWGQSLPMEVLVKIFQFAIHQDGAVPFLCR